MPYSLLLAAPGASWAHAHSTALRIAAFEWGRLKRILLSKCLAAAARILIGTGPLVSPAFKRLFLFLFLFLFLAVTMIETARYIFFPVDLLLII